MLPCVCLVIDHRRRQNVVRTSVTHSAIASCATFLFLPHFYVICVLLLTRRTVTWNLFDNPLLRIVTNKIVSFCIDNRLRQMAFFVFAKAGKGRLSRYVEIFGYKKKALSIVVCVVIMYRFHVGLSNSYHGHFIDLYHTAAILSPRSTKSFVFARPASHWMRG